MSHHMMQWVDGRYRMDSGRKMAHLSPELVGYISSGAFHYPSLSATNVTSGDLSVRSTF